MSKFQFHPIAELFPAMAPSDYAALVVDIRENGLAEPIWVYEGKILDGRNRFCACEDLGIEPVIVEYEGDEPIGFVISKNLHRRHLTQAQRALVAAELAQRPPHRPKKG